MADGRFDRFRCRLHHAADAQRQVQVRIARNAGGIDAGANLLQLLFQAVRRDVGQDEQELIPAVADERIALADAAADGFRRRLQRHISGVVAVSIVINFEVVQVHDGHARRAGGIPGNFFVIASVIRSCENIVVQPHVVAGRLAHEILAVLGVDGALTGRALDQFQHIGLAVHLIIARNDVCDIRPKGLQAALFPFGAERFFCRTMAGHPRFVAACITNIFAFGVHPGTFPDRFDRIGIQQTHICVEVPQRLDQQLHLFH